jgi:ABC-type phosphate/phosphonate transport system substrate-binding protein
MRRDEERAMGLQRRGACAALAAAALLGPAAVLAQAPARPKPVATKSGWRLLINEAVTGETNFFLLTARYRPLADYVTERLKGKTAIDVEPVVDIKRFVALAQGQPKPELVFGKSVNQLAKLVRDQGYQPIVRRADPYKAAFIVPKDSPLKTLADAAKGKTRIIMPDEYAATTAVARAELRVQNVTMAEIVHTKYQEAVAQQIKTGFGQIGVVNPTTARKWADDGGRVLAETQPVVNWSVLASPTLSAADVAQVREAFLAMSTQGASVMSSLGVKSWAAAERAEYLALLDYTKE